MSVGQKGLVIGNSNNNSITRRGRNRKKSNKILKMLVISFHRLNILEFLHFHLRSFCVFVIWWSKTVAKRPKSRQNKKIFKRFSTVNIQVRPAQLHWRNENTNLYYLRPKKKKKKNATQHKQKRRRKRKEKYMFISMPNTTAFRMLLTRLSLLLLVFFFFLSFLFFSFLFYAYDCHRIHTQ